jgi:nucleotide-binding universal stress UspA family protein
VARLKRILCATDLSAASTPAWAFAQRLAAATKVDLVLVHAVPLIPPPIEGSVAPGTYERVVEEGRTRALSACDELAESARTRGLAVTVHLAEGPAGPRILDAAERESADLVVLGTHGRTGLNRLLAGSVAEHVVQLSGRPVITVRPLPTPASLPDRPVARILYATDFSPASRRAWPWAHAIAERTGAEVDVLHVLLEVVPDRHLDPAFLAQAAERIRRDAQESAESLLGSWGLPRDRVRVHFTHGVEADAIAHWAASAGADLIVMGTHGRTGLLRLALGSVARRILHTAPCPVLTVGPHAPA